MLWVDRNIGHTKDLQNVLFESRGCGIMALSGTIFDILSKISIWEIYSPLLLIEMCFAPFILIMKIL
jgi:hypothetical protein